MKKLILLLASFVFVNIANAQYDDDDYGNTNDRFHYDDNFDWRWDVRVRISDGINAGRLTRREADRLYDRLERLERLEFDYQRDGFFSANEQDEVWDDLRALHRKIGFELNDWDRSYYGYSRPGYAYRGYNNWYDRNNYDFFRFDRRGFGSVTIGYRPRNYYPTYNRTYGYYYKNNGHNHKNHKNYDKNNKKWNKGKNNRDDDRDRSRNSYGSRDDRDNNRAGGRYGNNNENRTESRRENRNENANAKPERRAREEYKEPIQTPRRRDENTGRSEGKSRGEGRVSERANDSRRGNSGID